MSQVSPHDEELLDLALTHYQGTHPLWDHGDFKGLVNHGPMASEALVVLGRAGTLEAFRGWYYPTHLVAFEVPDTTRFDHEARLGDYPSLPMHTRRFLSQVRDADPLEVVREELPSLMPGCMAASLHGTLRLAHAVRAYQRRPSDPRRDEIAFALGLFAATYASLPGNPGAKPVRTLEQALDAVPRVPIEARAPGLISQRVVPVRTLPNFADVVESIDLSDDVGTQLARITAWSTERMLVERAARFAYLHATTSTIALRTLLPLFAENEQRRLLGFHLRALLAVHAAYDTRAHEREEATPTNANATTIENALIDRAIATKNDHMIKLTEAILREERWVSENENFASPNRHAALLAELEASR